MDYGLIFFIIILALIAIGIWYSKRTDDALEEIYAEINSEEDNDKVKKYIDYAKYKKKDPLDYYRIGALNDFNLKDTDAAVAYYVAALDGADDFVFDKIRDRIMVNDYLQQDEKRLDDYQIRELERKLVRPPKVVDTKAKKIEDRIKWTGDAGNVHDTFIDQAVLDQFATLRDRNIKNNTHIWQYPEIVAYIKAYQMRVPVEKANPMAAASTLDRIVIENPDVYHIGMKETEFVRHVFSDIMAEPNKEKQALLMENFINNLKDAKQGTGFVCINGRMSRIMSSYAGLDEQGLGEMKSHQVVKNEIFAKVGRLRDEILDQMPTEIQDKYNKGVEDNDTALVKEKMEKHIKDTFNQEYESMIKKDPSFLNDIYVEVMGTL